VAVKSGKHTAGNTLIEIMVAVVIVAIAALGGLSYQYFAAGHARIARCQMTATRIAQLLMEDWKSTGGSDEYDPTTLQLGFSTLFIPSYFSEGIGVGDGVPLRNQAYRITVDDEPMVVVLRWEDVAHDDVAQVTIRQLSVFLQWSEKSEIAPIVLSTYVRLDASGG